ncbi:hypothetical protein G6M26_10185 [Agrobacterium tumefaciens]|nr:hypothetical protein [Agrobacterium tumefaciens]NTE18887.1 hypothetical protein [Agrobacterium tumefaciens]
MKKRSLIMTLTVFATALVTGCKGNAQTYDLHKTLALVIIIGIILAFFALALFTNLLRDDVNDLNLFNANAARLKQQKKLLIFKSNNPFSLSRVQLGVWTVVISCSYIYLQLCMGNCNDTGLNETVLVLMGISAGVTAGGTIIDKREIQDGRVRHQNSPSEGFFVDILSDGNGISVHRFQKVIWTGVAVIIFLNKVYSIKTGCALPELSQTLLWLTGISSAAYLVLKTQENAPSIDSAAANNLPSDIWSGQQQATPPVSQVNPAVTNPVQQPPNAPSADSTLAYQSPAEASNNTSPSPESDHD